MIDNNDKVYGVSPRLPTIVIIFTEISTPTPESFFVPTLIHYTLSGTTHMKVNLP